MIVVKGHSLTDKGAAFRLPGCPEVACVATSRRRLVGSGHGWCSCGELSPHLTSNRERRSWHRAHKSQIAATL